VLTTSSAFLTAEPVAAGFFSFKEEYIESSDRRNCFLEKFYFFFLTSFWERERRRRRSCFIYMHTYALKSEVSVTSHSHSLLIRWLEHH
jgi:hypothetical protein